MPFLFCDKRPVAGIISGGSRVGRDRGAWVCEEGDKERERKTYKGKRKEREMSCK